MFARLAVSALIAGFGAGLLAALLQYVFVQPVLQHSELFETGALTHFGADPTMSSVPREDLDLVRQALNVIFAALVYTGYALILIAGMVLAEQRGHAITAKTGLIWGLCGFIAFQLAPAFGLPPDMPGLTAADVETRQIWWFATAGAAALGLWLVAFGQNWMMWGIALILLAAPHIIGAPAPDIYAGPAPPEMAADFATKTLGTTCAIWATLGCLLGAVWTSKLSEV